jgi:hypothetical protein
MWLGWGWSTIKVLESLDDDSLFSTQKYFRSATQDISINKKPNLHILVYENLSNGAIHCLFIHKDNQIIECSKCLKGIRTKRKKQQVTRD